MQKIHFQKITFFQMKMLSCRHDSIFCLNFSSHHYEVPDVTVYDHIKKVNESDRYKRNITNVNLLRFRKTSLEDGR